MATIAALDERGRCASHQEIPRGRQPWNPTPKKTKGGSPGHPTLVILSAARTSRSEVHAESKDPYTFHRAASVSGNSHDTLG